MTTLFIKNMVCDRCILVVKNEIEKLELSITNIQLGEVTVNKALSQQEKQGIAQRLIPLGFELIDDKKNNTVEKIKNIIIQLVHHQNNHSKTNLSYLLSDQLSLDYNYLSNLFSEIEGTTIEKYYIAQKIEKVKELIQYNELSLSEIAYQLHYSSVAHLSNQFKKITGLSPTQFKHSNSTSRTPLDKL